MKQTDISNKSTDNKDDDLVYFFKNFETILGSPERREIDNILDGIDFRVFSGYFLNDIREIKKRMSNADDEYLIYVCEHIYSITEWIELMVGSMSEIFRESWEKVFAEQFGDKNILTSIYTDSINKWLVNKSGQHQLGGNTYTVLDRNLYYRNRLGDWFQVDKVSAFDLQPKKKPVKDQSTVLHLDITYQNTATDQLIKEWEAQNYEGTLPEDFLNFAKEETNPQEYFDFSLGHIKNLLRNPVSIAELERWSGGKIMNLEDTVKLCSMALEVARHRRSDNSHTVYLLRDCIIFYQLHKTLDLLHSTETSSDQLLIGRRLLSYKPDQWGYYIVTLEALYEAHTRYPDNFDEFYAEYVRLIDLCVSVNPKFKALIDNLALYIKKHIGTKSDKIVVFDTGFQGSINLLTKYVIDRHINPNSTDNKVDTEIEISVGALWSEKLFEKRALSFYFPFLNRIQYMAMNDELYHYKFGSLKDGEIQVTMGGKDGQKKAAIELVVLVMITRLTEHK